MAVTQIDASRQVLDASVTNAKLAGSIALSKLATTVIQAGGAQAFTADQSMGGNKLTNVATPTAGTDAANKSYVDAAAAGIDWKASVRAATTANGALATAYENGDVIDGVTLATGDRILLKDQTTGSENGIYTVNASGAPTRATDADSNSEVTAGMAVFVEEGTTNADTGWIMTNNGAITLGTTALVFTQFTGIGSLTAGAGLTKTGNTIDVVSANGGIVANANDITLTLASNSVLEIVAGGLRLARGTSGQALIANGSGDPAWVSLGGDVSSVSAAGAVTLGSAIQRTANVITRETPSGSVNGSNTAFTLANTPVAGTEEVFLNGILQEPGAGNDYTISGATITYLTAPLTGDRIRVNYRK